MIHFLSVLIFLLLQVSAPDYEPGYTFPITKPFNQIAVNITGEIYLLSEQESIVECFSKDGQLVSSFGGQGTGRQFLNRPRSIHVDQSMNIYVSDYYNQRIVILSRELGLISTFSGEESSTVSFRYPVFAGLLPTNQLLILNGDNQELLFISMINGAMDRSGSVGYGYMNISTPGLLKTGGTGFSITDLADTTAHHFDLYGNQIGIQKLDKPKFAYKNNGFTYLSGTTIVDHKNNPIIDLFPYTNEPIVDYTFTGTALYVLTSHQVIRFDQQIKE